MLQGQSDFPTYLIGMTRGRCLGDLTQMRKKKPPQTRPWCLDLASTAAAIKSQWKSLAQGAQSARTRGAGGAWKRSTEGPSVGLRGIGRRVVRDQAGRVIMKRT